MWLRGHDRRGYLLTFLHLYDDALAEPVTPIMPPCCKGCHATDSISLPDGLVQRTRLATQVLRSKPFYNRAEQRPITWKIGPHRRWQVAWATQHQPQVSGATYRPSPPANFGIADCSCPPAGGMSDQNSDHSRRERTWTANGHESQTNADSKPTHELERTFPNRCLRFSALHDRTPYGTESHVDAVRSLQVSPTPGTARLPLLFEPGS